MRPSSAALPVRGPIMWADACCPVKSGPPTPCVSVALPCAITLSFFQVAIGTGKYAYRKVRWPRGCVLPSFFVCLDFAISSFPLRLCRPTESLAAIPDRPAPKTHRSKKNRAICAAHCCLFFSPRSLCKLGCLFLMGHLPAVLEKKKHSDRGRKKKGVGLPTVLHPATLK
jgi:hypothetical protein